MVTAPLDEAAIELVGLRKTYRGVEALQPLSLRIPPNSIVGVLGPNGAGKTTAFKLLLGLIRPSGGGGKVLGYDIVRDSMQVRRRTGYLSQDARFYDHMSARDVLAFVAGLHFAGSRKLLGATVDMALELAGLDGKDDRPVSGFSGGEKQRLGIAQAQIGRPALLILDEPAASLDPMGRRDVLEILGRLKGQTTVLYSTHILSDVERVADTVIILDRGSLLAQMPLSEVSSAARGSAGVYTVTLTGYTLELQAALRDERWVADMRVTSQGGRLKVRISTTDCKALEANLLRHLLTNPGVTILDFRREEASLEDLFLGLIEGRGASG